MSVGLKEEYSLVIGLVFLLRLFVESVWKPLTVLETHFLLAVRDVWD